MLAMCASQPPLAIEFENTCLDHRAQFGTIMDAFEIADPGEHARIRGRFKIEVMKTYPGSYTEFVAKRTAGLVPPCMGCAFERAGPSCYQWAVDLVIRLACEAAA